jgi:probable rRNA maturation factor
LTVDLADVPAELRSAVRTALQAAGVDEGHLSVELVEAERIRELNREHRGTDQPTDVLAFPMDGPGSAAGPRELGDVVICPERAESLVEVAVHGVLHLCGYDHETDDGEMLVLQQQVLEQWYRDMWAVWTRAPITLERVRTGELDEAIAYNAPDVVLDVSGFGWPDAKLFHGQDGVLRFFEMWFETFDDVRIDLVELQVAGSRCFSLVHQRGRGHGSGAEVELTFGVAITERDGKFKRVEFHTDLEAARAAAGLS